MKTNTETEVIDADELFAVTYTIYENSEGGLHMAIFEESPEHAELVAVATNIHPQDIKERIEDVRNWRYWDGLANGSEMEDLEEDLRNGCAVVQNTNIGDFGHCRITHWDAMGLSARKAFAWMDEKDGEEN